MKKFLFPFMVLLFMTAASCSMTGSSTDSPADEFRDSDVSIYNGDREADEIYSYTADVTSYYSHDRKAIDMEVRQEYRLSLKMINGSLYTRLDFSGEAFPDQRSRSIISSPEEQVLIYPDSNEVLERYPVPSSEGDPLFSSESDRLPMSGRMDIGTIKNTASRLSFDVNDATPGLLTLSYPKDFFPGIADGSSESDEIISCKVSFDTEDETLFSTEMVIAESDGSIRTITTYPLFAESETGEEGPIEIGTLTIDKNDFGERIDTSDSITAEYETVEDVPLISANELKKKAAEGEITSEDTEIWLGDLSDPNYTETYLDLYENIELNTIDDSLFRIVL